MFTGGPNGPLHHGFSLVLRIGRSPFGMRKAYHGPATIDDGESMPFKSRAQRRKFAQLLVEGKISDETFEEWNRETGRKKLPERVAPKSKASRKAKPRRTRRSGKKR
jgi:hypothetical protein